MKLTYKTEIDPLIVIENKLVITKVAAEINQELRVNIHTHTAYTKWINSKDLLQSTGNYTQYCVITYKGKQAGTNRCMCMYE